MGVSKNLTDFAHGETVKFTVQANERDGTDLASPASATMTIRIGTGREVAALYEFSASPQVVLTDAGTSTWTITLATGDIPLLTEGTTYLYDIYTTSAGGDVLHQAGGLFWLKPAMEA